jgi:hypothetical protein
LDALPTSRQPCAALIHVMIAKPARGHAYRLMRCALQPSSCHRGPWDLCGYVVAAGVHALEMQSLLSVFCAWPPVLPSSRSQSLQFPHPTTLEGDPDFQYLRHVLQIAAMHLRLCRCAKPRAGDACSQLPRFTTYLVGVRPAYYRESVRRGQTNASSLKPQASSLAPGPGPPCVSQWPLSEDLPLPSSGTLHRSPYCAILGIARRSYDRPASLPL